MKKLIVLILLSLLLFSLVACEKNQEESTTLEENTTSETTTEESSLEVETLEPKEEFHLFDEDMEANFDGYNTVEFTTNNIKYSAKIPEHWSSEYFSCEKWIEDWGEYPQHCGLKLFSREIPEKRYLDDGTFYVAESISSLFTPTPTIESDFAIQQSLTTQTGLEMDIYLEKAEPTKFSDCDGYTGEIIIKNKQSICIFVEIFKDDNIQELFNVLNSIEITKSENLLTLNMSNKNFEKVDSIDIIDMRTGDEILITNKTQVQNIIKFVKNVKGENRESSKGICNGLYSIDFMSGKKTINGVGLGEYGFNYGEGEDGYPYRYEYCDGINYDVVFQFFDNYFTHN